jgi:single-strand DNA-binding protein
MANMNTVTLIGRLVRDAELKQTTNSRVAKFAVAVNRWDGTEEVASFFDCVLWGRRADSLTEYLTKGTQVGLRGELQQERWEKDGQTRSRVVINVRDVQLLGGKKREDSLEDDFPF